MKFNGFTFASAVLLVLASPERASGDTFGVGANMFEIEFVEIGDPDVGADPTGGPGDAGFVDYSYRIAKFAISEATVDMATASGALGIDFFPARGPDQPATGVSWLEAAHFVNWLNTSTGNQAAYKFNGSDFELWEPGDPGYDADNLFRNSLARYLLPSTNEWYKAAFYDAGNGAYWDFPTGSDSDPTAVAGGTAPGTAVWNQSFEQGPADVTQAGGLSPYGTMGQGGNVFEWEETSQFLDNTQPGARRGVRGGKWDDFTPDWMSSTFRLDGSPPDEDGTIGYRVASRADGTTGVSLGQLQERIRLEQNHPNPFNPLTTIRFTLPEGGAVVDLTILDVAGRSVKSLVSEALGGGVQQVLWDGRDDEGRPVGTGVYVYRLTVGDRTVSRKMHLLK